VNVDGSVVRSLALEDSDLGSAHREAANEVALARRARDPEAGGVGDACPPALEDVALAAPDARLPPRCDRLVGVVRSTGTRTPEPQLLRRACLARALRADGLERVEPIYPVDPRRFRREDASHTTALQLRCPRVALWPVALSSAVTVTRACKSAGAVTHRALVLPTACGRWHAPAHPHDDARAPSPMPAGSDAASRRTWPERTG
jgi:hypothetical protein